MAILGLGICALLASGNLGRRIGSRRKQFVIWKDKLMQVLTRLSSTMPSTAILTITWFRNQLKLMWLWTAYWHLTNSAIRPWWVKMEPIILLWKCKVCQLKTWLAATYSECTAPTIWPLSALANSGKTLGWKVRTRLLLKAYTETCTASIQLWLKIISIRLSRRTWPNVMPIFNRKIVRNCRQIRVFHCHSNSNKSDSTQHQVVLKFKKRSDRHYLSTRARALRESRVNSSSRVRGRPN